MLINLFIIPALRINNTFAGKLYSFPFNKSVQVLYYNKDMFQETLPGFKCLLHGAEMFLSSN